MSRHLFLFACAVFSLFLAMLSPAWGDFSLNGDSSFDTFNHDLDNIHLRLEKLNADWQLTPSAGNKLTVNRLRAKRMLVTFKETSNSSESPLPNEIKLPFPIHIKQGEIAEVIVVNKEEQYILTDVKFSFDGTSTFLKLNLQQAQTPWGDAKAAINLATANPFSISGKVNLKEQTGQNPYDIEALLSGNLETLKLASESNLILQDNQLSIIQADGNTPNPAAKILTKMELGLTDDYPIKLSSSINALHLERLGNYPNTQLNIDIKLQGKLLPQPDLQLNFASRDSLLQNQAVSSSGKLKINNAELRDINIQAALLNNKFSAKGDLNQPNSVLKWQLDIPNLSAFGTDYSGQAYADGTVEGVLDNAAMQFNLQAEKLEITDILKLNKLEGQANLMAGDSGKLEGDLKVSDLQYGTNPAINGNMRVEGTRSDHQIKLTAQHQEMKFASSLQGGLETISNWQGTLQSFSYQGMAPVELQAPAKLNVSSNEILLQNANFKLLKGEALIENLQFGSGDLSSKGQLKGLAINDLPLTFASQLDQQHSNLSISGLWDIKADDAVNGEISFWRESGDISFTTVDNKPLALGLNVLEVKATFDQNRAALDVKLEGKQLGNLNTQLATTLTKTKNGYAILSSAPLKLSSTAALRTLAWLPIPTAFSDADIDGQLTMNVHADGTIGSPNLTGMVAGKNLQLSLLSEGVSLTQGTIEANFDKDQLLIKKASWKGGEGYLNTSGTLRFADNRPEITMDWKAEKFTALSRSDRILILSGEGKTILNGNLLTISGNFTADKGFIQLAEVGTPKLGDDVIVLGQTESVPEGNLKVLLSGLRFDLGNDFTIRGQGIDARLGGAVTLSGLSEYSPYAEGSIYIARGTYLAYGQTLTIVEGRFIFSGPLDNPGITLRAMRNSRPVNAGVEITGTAYSPVTKLISNPNVPDSEKLSWLVLGHGMDQAGRNEFAMLSLAAGAILSQDESVPLQTKLARAAGLDELSFSGGAEAESTALTLGKRLSSNLYLSYQKSINGLLDVARLTYNMTPRWSLRAESGTESAVDVLYTFSFK